MILSRALTSRVLCITAAACAEGIAAVAAVDVSGSTAYRFDAVAAHIWESEASMAVSVRSDLTFGVTVLYVDATQDSIQGINRLRGQVLSATADAKWHTLQNRLLVDARLGVDGTLGWKVNPAGELSLRAVLPVPANPVFQNLAFTPKAWYHHRTPNGPAIRSHIALYGYAAELGAAMGTKGAIAANFQQEFLSPASQRLDTSFIDTGIIHNYHDELPVFNLPDNRINSFYAYLYRQILSPLYLGYAFSWVDARIDRRVTTDMNMVPNMRPGPGQAPVSFQDGVAYYPYVTPQNMMAHSISVTLHIPFGAVLLWKSTIVFPVYSRQDIHYVPLWETDLRAILNPERYGYYEEKFTGPLSMKSDVTWNVSPHTGLTLTYDFFGFPYKSWAYFTKDSYSLHTLKLSMKRRF